MLTSNPTDRQLVDRPSCPSQIAEHYVGQQIKVQRTDGWNSEQWALIRMVLPSISGLCWLIEYRSGDTDVVRVFANPNRFVLAKPGSA